MKDRCLNPNFRQWARYGGRGIKVCDRWLDPRKGFQNFLDDMGERPAGYTLDRIDNDGNYEPSNCKWSTRTQQQRNQSVTRTVVISGRAYIAAELSEISGLKTDTIIDRCNRGLSYEEVMSPEKRVFVSGLKLGGKANGARQRSKTHCKNGHPYNEQNTLLTPQGFRACRQCHADRQRERNARLREANP
jgi:hypothetical protein